MQRARESRDMSEFAVAFPLHIFSAACRSRAFCSEGTSAASSTLTSNCSITTRAIMKFSCGARGSPSIGSWASSPPQLCGDRTPRLRLSRPTRNGATLSPPRRECRMPEAWKASKELSLVIVIIYIYFFRRRSKGRIPFRARGRNGSDTVLRRAYNTER